MIDFRIHQVSYSENDANGFIGIQFDAFGEQKSGMPTIEAHFPTGYAARPLDPDLDVDKNPLFGCNVLIGWEGEEAHAWPLSDPRSRLVTALLQRGESMMYGASGNFVRMHADGRISLFTTDDNTPNGKTVALQVKPDGLLFSSPWGKLTFDATGFHVLHSSGAAIDLGAIGGLPDPLSAINSYVKLTAGMIQREATILADGPATPTSEPVAKATSMQAVLVAMSTALADINAAFVALGAIAAGAPNSGAAVQISAATTAIAAAETAISEAALAVPSASLAVGS